MTNIQAAEKLRKFAAEPQLPFAWPLDSDYDQHIKFVRHRNENWKGGTRDDFNRFMLDYADSLLLEN